MLKRILETMRRVYVGSLFGLGVILLTGCTAMSGEYLNAGIVEEHGEAEETKEFGLDHSFRMATCPVDVSVGGCADQGYVANDYLHETSDEYENEHELDESEDEQCSITDETGFLDLPTESRLMVLEYQFFPPTDVQMSADFIEMFERFTSAIADRDIDVLNEFIYDYIHFNFGDDPGREGFFNEWDLHGDPEESGI